jgi:hypothetical protein
MEDIEVEQRRPSILPWIIGLLLLSVAVWGLMEIYGAAAEAESTGPAPDTAIVDAGGGAVRSVSPGVPDRAANGSPRSQPPGAT